VKIYLANPRGFCAGVDRAIDIVDLSLQTYGSPIYVRHEIVHSRHVVNSLREKGAVFVEELNEVPDVLIALKQTNTEEPSDLGILSAGYQNGNLLDGSSPVSNVSNPVPIQVNVSNPVPIQVAYNVSPSSISSGLDSHSSAAVHTEDALCSLGSWCESTPVSYTQTTSPPTTTVCQLGEWC